jgi:hypothetical protein
VVNLVEKKAEEIETKKKWSQLKKLRS